MGNAEFCPLCGDIVGGWDLPFQPHTCKGEPGRQRMATEGGADLRTRLVGVVWSHEQIEPMVAEGPSNLVDAILGAIAEAGWHLVKGCGHESAGGAGWDCDECFEEGYQRWQKAERERAEREGRIKRYRLIPVDKPGDLDRGAGRG